MDDEKLIEQLNTFRRRAAEIESKLAGLPAPKKYTLPKDEIDRRGFLEKISEASPDLFYIFDIVNREVIYTNRSMSKALGYSSEEISKNIDSFDMGLMHKDDMAKVKENFVRWESATDEDVLESEFRMKAADGQWRWFKTRDKVFRRSEDGRVKLITGTAQDVTDSVRAYMQIVEAHKRLELVVENMPCLVDAIDGDQNIIFWNRECERVTGYSSEEVVGNPNAINLLYPDDEYREKMLKKWAKREDEFYNWEWDIIDKDGIRHTVAWSNISKRVPIPGWASWAVGVDVTGRKQLERQLIHTQKTEALGTLAGGIAHDFNNILTAILGHADLTLGDAEDNAKITSGLNEIIRAAERARDLVQQILSFSRRMEDEEQPVQMKHIVKETGRLLRGSFPSTIEIKLDIDEQCPSVLSSPTSIHQLLMNLCTNAYHAMKDKGGVLKISLRSYTLTAESSPDYDDAQPGDYVLLRISDTGHGMDETTLAKIFDPYFTTRENGEGTGLGLTLVKNIVKNLNGGLSVRSQVEGGTTFDILIPEFHEDPESSPQIPKPTPEKLEGSERVLLIDDEEDVLTVYSLSLKRLGYNVTSCSDSSDALGKILTAPDDFDIIVTDLTMPRKSGLDIALTARELRSDIPIILCTGHGQEETEERAFALGVREILHKPFTGSTLAASIRRALVAE